MEGNQDISIVQGGEFDDANVRAALRRLLTNVFTYSRVWMRDETRPMKRVWVSVYVGAEMYDAIRAMPLNREDAVEYLLQDLRVRIGGDMVDMTAKQWAMREKL